jgi:periplasmic mercuric ion binding protein
MKHRLDLAAVAATALLMLAPLSARAGEQTVVLDVHHADCVLCGPIVKASLARVNGVKAVAVSQPDAMADVTATVKFDDAATNVPNLIAATTKAGYPSAVKQ